MKKILLVVNKITEGGVEQVLCDFISSVHHEFEIQVLAIYQTDSRYVQEIKKLVKVDFLDDKRKCFKNRIMKSLYSRMMDHLWIQQILYNRFVSSSNPDIHIAFSEGQATLLVAHNKNANIRKQAWVHTDFLSEHTRENFYKYCAFWSRTYRLFYKIAFVSKTLEDKYKNILGLHKTCCIYNSLNPLRISRLLNIENKEDIRPNTINFVVVGRLSYEKGVDRILKSLSKLPTKDLQKVCVVIIGEGKERKSLEDLAHKNNIKNNVVFMGSMSNPYAIMEQAHYVLSPSRYEAFGLVILEALFLKKRIIATRTVGSIDILQNGHYGVVLENEDNAFDSVFSDIIHGNFSYKFPTNEDFEERCDFFSQAKFKNNIVNFIS